MRRRRWLARSGESRGRGGGVTIGFRGAIFDVDGVLVASPHERAWRESLGELLATEWRATGAAIGYSPE